MGFTADQAIMALRRCNNLQEAINNLLQPAESESSGRGGRGGGGYNSERNNSANDKSRGKVERPERSGKCVSKKDSNQFSLIYYERVKSIKYNIVGVSIQVMK